MLTTESHPLQFPSSQATEIQTVSMSREKVHVQNTKTHSGVFRSWNNKEDVITMRNVNVQKMGSGALTSLSLRFATC